MGEDGLVLVSTMVNSQHKPALLQRNGQTRGLRPAGHVMTTLKDNTSAGASRSPREAIKSGLDFNFERLKPRLYFINFIAWLHFASR
ncbi:hypothetical protein RRG08_056014 [Elysia crispata]|uniref:Uncharacterized protein n=1 Tax=Elysia crispata TaxID=231223 RepID=A0AAE1AGS8_9GAST|nr:hypothetical protein RRG08_056014 [Elysia crispata]